MLVNYYEVGTPSSILGTLLRYRYILTIELTRFLDSYPSSFHAQGLTVCNT